MDLIARELHKPARRNYPTRRVELKGINDLYQADLVEMIPHAKINKNYKYILTMINCFSKYAIAKPLKTKSAANVAAVLAPILQKHKMRNFQTDQGKEFFNTSVAKLMQKHGINHYHTYSDKKASIIERLNRTLKSKMFEAFTAQGSYKWLHLLPRLIKVYNNSVHRTIQMKPNEVGSHNERDVLQAINTATFRRSVKIKPKFKVGDQVRVSRVKMTFTKAYIGNWSYEIFVVDTVVTSRPITYIIRDGRGELISGKFYEQELSKTNIPNLHLVQKVLKRKGDLLFVRWRGYDDSHNSWIHKNDIH
jgi:hypothetical protein